MLLALVAAIATATATLFPPSGPSAFGGAISIYADRAAARPIEFETLAPDGPADPADPIAVCRGQSWGEEQAECLAAIARSAGRSDRLVRMVVADQRTTTQAPNIF